MVAHIFIDQQCLWHISAFERIDEARIITLVEHIEVVDCRLVCYMATRRCRHLVEDRQGIAHSSVGLAGDHIKSRPLGCYALL